MYNYSKQKRSPLHVLLYETDCSNIPNKSPLYMMLNESSDNDVKIDDASPEQQHLIQNK